MRLIFDKKDDFLKWAREFVSKDRYALYTSNAGEILLKPTKSTHRWDEGYFKPAETEEFKTIVKTLEEQGITHINVARFEFDTSKPVGVRTTL